MVHLERLQRLGLRGSGEYDDCGRGDFIPVAGELRAVQPCGGNQDGSDGALWFAHTSGNIWRTTTSGVMTQYPVPYPTSRQGTLGGIATGPEGSLWTTLTGFDRGDSECVVADAGVRAGHAGELRERNDNGELRLKPATAATWTVSVAGTTQIDRPLPRVAPPRAFTVQFANIASQGNVLVESELANTRRELLCAEWETVNSGPPP